ncbi:MAG: polyphosphate kinase 1 [Acidobacteria bacterium]|nr:polyphosphate kinase 1 [Acidobacteriota bacterium]
MTSTNGRNASLFINRELSWLAFDERVLGEAEDETVPLLERLKFASIAAANLDEFFMVRVAKLKRAIEDDDVRPDLAGMTPAEQLAAVRNRARTLMARIYTLTSDVLLPALASEGIRIVAWDTVAPPEQAALTSFFRDAVLPVLTPLAVDASRPFPLLSSLSLNLVLLLEPGADDTQPRLAVVQVPAGLARLVRVPGADGPTFVLLEDIVRASLAHLFPGQPIREVRCIRLSRDAELELDDEGGRTQLEQVERELRRRRRSDITRLEVDADVSVEMRDILEDRLDIEAEEVFLMPGPLDMRLLMGLVDLPGCDRLREPAFVPVNPLEDDADVFTVLDQRDVLLHHPYESFDPVLAFVAQAAQDPDVLAIKQTLYRATPGSSLIESLRRAAERNKQVTVVVELTARFDEERNIQWARALEEAGAHVVYGVRGYKTHAKMCLVVRRTPTGLRRYLHLGTGNYNERTARVYTDFGLMTSRPAFCEDASAVFNALTGYSDPPQLHKLAMAPTGLRQRLLRLIRREQRFAESGRPAAIAAKVNALVDEQVILALYEASTAGVDILLCVRGICALRPGVPGVSERVRVVSLVDRFLEHSRIYRFENGGDQEVYLASADWMTRNFDHRIELMFPIEHSDHRRTVTAALDAMFRDNVKAYHLDADGTYRRRARARDQPPFRVQQALLEDISRMADTARQRAGVSLQPR